MLAADAQSIKGETENRVGLSVRAQRRVRFAQLAC